MGFKVENKNYSTISASNVEKAFEQGANECNVTPDEFTQDEFLALGNAIKEEITHVSDFSLAIRQGRDKPLSVFFSRAETWANRYNDLRNLGKVITCEDQKLLWELGATEQHCRTCPKLDGKVKRASEWKAQGMMPQKPPYQLKNIYSTMQT